MLRQPLRPLGNVNRLLSALRLWSFAVTLAILGMVMMAAGIYVAILINNQQKTLSELSSYNITGAASQAALEVSRLETALESFIIAGPKADPTGVQVRFDIIFNRISVLDHGDSGEMIHHRPDLMIILNQLRDTMTAAEPLLENIEKPGYCARILALILPLDVSMTRLAGASRDSDGNMVAGELKRLHWLHWIFSGMLIALITCCSSLIAVLIWNNRKLSSTHRLMADMVHGLQETGVELAVAQAQTERTATEIQQRNQILQDRDHELELQNARFEAALDNMSQALCMVGADDQLIVCNKPFIDLFAISRPAGGFPVADLFVKVTEAKRYDSKMIRRICTGQQALVGQKGSGSFMIEGQSGPAAAGGAGHERTLAVSHRPMGDGGWVATYSDITERQISNRQMMQAQKMEAIGHLTGGITHDFNNLLAVISLNLETLLSRSDEPDKVREHGNQALQATLRGAGLISQILAFARPRLPALQHIHVNTWIRSIATLLEPTLGTAINVLLSLNADIWPVSADPTRLETAIANLMTNARDAMPFGGRLSISTRNRSLAAAITPPVSGMNSGDYVMIEIADTGTGMPPDIAARVFEPFFTTKDDLGTGLGLSMVYGFVHQSGGHIGVTSKPGHGTVFKMFFPRAYGETPDEIKPLPATIVALPKGDGEETILLVEDDEAIRHVTTDVLMHLGYDVIVCDSPLYALKILKSPRRIDLLFSDVMMPGGMNGYALLEEAAVLRPGLKMMLASGYTNSEGQNANTEPVRLLSKPYRQSELAQMVRETLDS